MENNKTTIQNPKTKKQKSLLKKRFCFIFALPLTHPPHPLAGNLPARGFRVKRKHMKKKRKHNRFRTSFHEEACVKDPCGEDSCSLRHSGLCHKLVREGPHTHLTMPLLRPFRKHRKPATFATLAPNSNTVPSVLTRVPFYRAHHEDQ